jgi:peptidyl-prolyl cis-trans isomerase A (cyclophilin A)
MRLHTLFALAAFTTFSACAPQQLRTARTAEPAAPPYTPGVVPDSFVVRLSTSKGDVDAIIRRHWAPLGAGQFYDAVSTGYYDGARFFRTVRGFVSQFGLAADPALSAEWRSKQIADDSVLQSNRRGSLVFAAGGPGTRTTQMFINLRDNARLDAMGFSPIGEIVRGIDAVDSLYTGYGDGANAPQQDRIGAEGEAYLAANFPLLDRIVVAKVVRAWFPAATPATSPNND